MADRILPSLLVLMVVGKSLHDELIDSIQGDFLVGCCLYGHGYQGYVAVRRLLGLFPSTFQLEEAQIPGARVVGRARASRCLPGPGDGKVQGRDVGRTLHRGPRVMWEDPGGVGRRLEEGEMPWTLKDLIQEAVETPCGMSKKM